MKKILLTISLLAIVLLQVNQAQVSSSVFTSSSGTYTEITGGTVLIDGTSAMDSWVSAAITIPSFTFNGVAYTTAYALSNGFITLGGTVPNAYSSSGISYPGGSGISICPFAADLDKVDSTSEMRWETVGNEIVFQWKKIKRYGNTESFDFQIRLNTVTGVVKFVYQLNSGPASGTSFQPQVGIRTSTTDFNNRKVASGTENWDTSLPGTLNSNTCRFTSAAPQKNFTSGLTYTFTPATCLSPGNVIISNITTTSADMSWTAPAFGTPVSYIWKVVLSGAGSGGAAVASGTETHPDVSASATSLTTATNYDFFVRTFCGGSDSSYWAGPVPFATTCLPSNIPYSQDFESAIVPAIPVCTSIQNAGTGNNWATASAPGTGFTSKTLKYLYSPTSSANAWFYTSGLNLTGGVSYHLTFRYGNNFNSWTEKLKISYGTAAINTSMTNVLLDFPNINQAAPQYADTNFTVSTSGVYYIGFNCYSDTNQFNLYVDDILVEVTPTCPGVTQTGFTATNPTANSVVLNWVEAGTATQWQIEHGLSGFTQGTGTYTIINSASPYTLTALQNITSYDVYIRSICTPGDTSSWKGPVSFTTSCGVNTVPFTEDFSGTTFPPACWTRWIGLLAVPCSLTTTTAGWVQDDFGNVLTPVNKSARTNIYGASRKHWLVTPAIDLGSGMGTYILSFDLALTKYNNDSIAPDTNGIDDKFAVVISLDSGATWTSANTLRLWNNAGSNYVYNDISQTGENVVLDLSSYSGIVKFGFYGESTVSNADNDLFVDNINIKDSTIVAVNEYSNSPDINIFPNPTNGMTNVVIRGITNADLTIYTLQGQTVYTEKITNNKQLNLSYLPKGIYMIRVSDAKNNILKKLILQ